MYLPVSTKIYLSANNSGAQFSLSPSFASTVSQITIPANSASADVYFKQTTVAAGQTITATDNPSAPDGDTGINDALQTETLTNGAIGKFVVASSSPIAAIAGMETESISIHIQNQYGIEIPRRPTRM